MEAYVKSVKMSRKLGITLDFKENGTVVFEFEKQEDLRMVQEDIQGEVCSVSVCSEVKVFKKNSAALL